VELPRRVGKKALVDLKRIRKDTLPRKKTWTELTDREFVMVANRAGFIRGEKWLRPDRVYWERKLGD